LGVGGWALRLGTASCIFALTQLAFVAAEDKGVSLTIVRDGGFFRGKLGGLLEQGVPQLVHRYPNWSDGLAVMDAAVVGTVLVLSVSAGWVVAIRQYKKWRAVLDRISD
jgi:hypothetical protein